jgi:hypothetical protein
MNQIPENASAVLKTTAEHLEVVGELPESEAKAAVGRMRYNEAQSVYAMLFSGFVADMRQIEILNNRRLRPEPTEEEATAAEDAKKALALEIKQWNLEVDQKKIERLKRRLEKQKASLGISD